jgi:hypothetical protein
MATIGAGVTSEAPTAVEALRMNSAEMQKVIDRIKALGIAEKDIQTTGINLNEFNDYFAIFATFRNTLSCTKMNTHSE